jgi:hypothetical protein
LPEPLRSLRDGVALRVVCLAADLPDRPRDLHIRRRAVLLGVTDSGDLEASAQFALDQRTLPGRGLPRSEPLVWSALKISGARYGSDRYDADYLDSIGWVT